MEIEIVATIDYHTEIGMIIMDPGPCFLMLFQEFLLKARQNCETYQNTVQIMLL